MRDSHVCQTDCSSQPQVCVDWCDAYAYCKAVGKRLCGSISGGAIDTTSSAREGFDQWYNACTSHGANPYPYGSSLSSGACNHYPASTCNSTVQVASLATCQSAVSGYTGIFDMSGNAQEWEDSCASLDDKAECNVRGGFFYDEGRSEGLSCAAQRAIARNAYTYGTGFRCCSN